MSARISLLYVVQLKGQTSAEAPCIQDVVESKTERVTLTNCTWVACLRVLKRALSVIDSVFMFVSILCPLNELRLNVSGLWMTTIALDVMHLSVKQGGALSATSKRVACQAALRRCTCAQAKLVRVLRTGVCLRRPFLYSLALISSGCHRCNCLITMDLFAGRMLCARHRIS